MSNKQHTTTLFACGVKLGGHGVEMGFSCCIRQQYRTCYVSTDKKQLLLLLLLSPVAGKGFVQAQPTYERRTRHMNNEAQVQPNRKR